MLSIGHEFVRNGVQFCVVDIIDYNDRSFYFLSEERKNEKMNFHFYECNIESDGDISLNLVRDDELTSTLYGLLEEGK